MQVIITNNDVTNLKKFMLLHSKAAKKQRVISTYAVPFEFILAGLIIDGLLKTAPLASISSLVLAILWLVFYPKFYKKLLQKHLGDSENLESSRIAMNFICDDKFISFSESLAPKNSEKFDIQTLTRITESSDNYFLGFSRGHHIVLPKSDETTLEVINLSEKREIPIENVEI